MKAHIEWKVGIIRAGPQFLEFGDPYEFVCVVSKDGGKAHISGAAGKFTRETREAVKSAIVAEGIEEVTWEKRSNKTRKLKKTN